MIEHTELFVRKSGGERLAQLYEFEHRGRALALRPEHTASVMRYYVDQLQADPLPIRLAYSGPVFRYESPQAGRSRQFTEFGCELIGASGLMADVEMISTALDCLQAGGIVRPRMVVGHIGVVVGFLEDLNLDQRAQDWLLWSMERIRRGERDATNPPEHLTGDGAANETWPELEDAFNALDRDAVVNLLRQSGVRFDSGSRTGEEIVQGLFDKRARHHDRAALDDAINFVQKLVALSGSPQDVLDPLRELVASRNLSTTPLDEIEAIVDILAAERGTELDISIDLGLGRGLRYYTGILFEIYPEDGDLQLCGGGRYDDLAQHLGARGPIPASGFSLGLERVLHASSENLLHPGDHRILVLADEEVPRMLETARELREAGWVAVLEVRGRSDQAARRWAQRQSFDAIAKLTSDGVEITRLSDGATSKGITPPPAATDTVRP